MSGDSTSRVLMVEPVRFRANEETLADNNFQLGKGEETFAEIERKAQEEFSECVTLLRDHGINVQVFTPHSQCESPDVPFARHWFSTHTQLGGVFVIYPMRSQKRRTERSPEIIEFLRRRYPTEIDLTQYEERGEFLEAQGSLVLDRRQRVAYMAASTRSSERLAERWSSLLGYRLLLFNAAGRDGRPIFHTELILSIGDDHIIWCPEVIGEESVTVMRDTMEESGRDLIEITREQAQNFVGTTRLLGAASGKVNFMSTRAFNSLNEDQKERIERYGKIIHCPLDTFETYSGGSGPGLVAELA